MHQLVYLLISLADEGVAQMLQIGMGGTSYPRAVTWVATIASSAQYVLYACL